EREWDRLSHQHQLWRDSLLEPLTKLGLGPGARVLEVGCGAGHLLAELARATIPGGSATGIEQDPRGAQAARHTCSPLQKLNVHIQVRTGDLFTTELGGPYDFVVARWVFSFLREPTQAIERLVTSLAPGGVLAIQDYNHDGFRLFPGFPTFDTVVEAYRAVYRDRGGDLWIGGRLPAMLTRAGLDLVELDPRIRAGRPGSPTFQWVERFLLEHLDTVVDSGHLPAVDAESFREDWSRARSLQDTVLFSPIQVTVAGRLVPGPTP
ncbi:MAG: methyltransferase domain-containing protein, partial [Myxococcota bacterium]|nr:methyltransferase domain-containing protein [Myxococcota bacterium]